MFRLKRRAQSSAEYAVVIALVVAAAVAMQIYVKRGLQGSVKFAVDKAQRSDSASGQYEPYYLESSYDTATSGYQDTEETKTGGAVTREFGAEGKEKTVTRSGYEKTRSPEQAD
jgi:hypothetical protein